MFLETFLDTRDFCLIFSKILIIREKENRADRSKILSSANAYSMCKIRCRKLLQNKMIQRKANIEQLI